MKRVSLSASYAAKIWILNENIEKDVFFDKLKEGCKANSSFEYRLFIDGERL